MWLSILRYIFNFPSHMRPARAFTGKYVMYDSHENMSLVVGCFAHWPEPLF